MVLMCEILGTRLELPPILPETLQTYHRALVKFHLDLSHSEDVNHNGHFTCLWCVVLAVKESIADGNGSDGVLEADGNGLQILPELNRTVQIISGVFAIVHRVWPLALLWICPGSGHTNLPNDVEIFCQLAMHRQMETWRASPAGGVADVSTYGKGEKKAVDPVFLRKRKYFGVLRHG